MMTEGEDKGRAYVRSDLMLRHTKSAGAGRGRGSGCSIAHTIVRQGNTPGACLSEHDGLIWAD